MAALGPVSRVPPEGIPRSELAREASRHPAYHGAAMAALWEQSRDVSDPDVVRAVAVGAGLDPTPVDEAIAPRRFRTVVEASRREAHRLGINAVPAFAVDERDLILGAQPQAAFEHLLTGRERPDA